MKRGGTGGTYQNLSKYVQRVIIRGENGALTKDEKSQS